MPRRRKTTPRDANGVRDFRHADARRPNNPPAGIAPTYEVRERQTTRYSYDPHLDPQLIWAGKAEHTSFEVDVVPLHIHERISTRAILEAVKKPEPQLALFGETPLPAHQQIEFYRHEVGWANRLILGDSLLVMNSLLVKEGMAGKVQMIYVDPPYGIKYASNFQPRIDRRDVRDRDEDLTHEPEQIKAYRDTWTLGIHSYLTYLRDRLLLCRELLSESGSIFVQINDENLHLVRCLMDEVFGRENFVATVPFKKTATSTALLLSVTYDYLLWYTKNKETAVGKFRALLVSRPPDMIDRAFTWVEQADGWATRITKDVEPVGRRFQTSSLMSQHPSLERSKPYEFEGKSWVPAMNRQWSTSHDGLERLRKAERLLGVGKTLTYKRYADDFPYVELSNVWGDTMESTFAVERLYAVQTAPKVIERCILDHRPGRPGLRPHLRLWHHRLVRREVGTALDHLRYQPRRPGHRPPAADDGEVRLLRAARARTRSCRRLHL
jgi:adenine-specific DNA-methyltransferase